MELLLVCLGVFLVSCVMGVIWEWWIGGDRGQ